MISEAEARAVLERWIAQVDHYRGAGLTRTLEHMLGPVRRRTAFPDPWAETEWPVDDPPF